MNPSEQDVEPGQGEAQRPAPPAAPASLRPTEKPGHAAIEQGKETVREIGGVIAKPGVSATITGGLVLGAAVLFGIPEALVGAGAAWVAYRTLKRSGLSR